jgi:hypothetical protein
MVCNTNKSSFYFVFSLMKCVQCSDYSMINYSSDYICQYSDDLINILKTTDLLLN